MHPTVSVCGGGQYPTHRSYIRTILPLMMENETGKNIEKKMDARVVGGYVGNIFPLYVPLPLDSKHSDSGFTMICREHVMSGGSGVQYWGGD